LGALPLIERLNALKALRSSLIDHAEDYVQTLSSDFGYRSRHETLITEVSVVVSAIDHAIKYLPRWVRPTKIGLSWPFWPASARMVPQARGVAAIIGPSNYPVQLTLLPLVSAIAAGCRTIVKPSERTPQTAAMIKRHLADSIDQSVAFVANGDASIAERIARFPLDILLFTGSHATGLRAAAAAAANMTPIVLELGGKSPAIVDRSADLDLAARKIVAGKLLNAGQTCVAPDYVLVPADLIDPFTVRAREAAQRLYPDSEAVDYSAILSAAGIDRLKALEAGHKVIPLFSQSLSSRRYRPSLVLDPDLTSEIMQTEIFGPLLPVLPYERLDDALRIIKDRPTPLVLYWFGTTGAAFDRTMNQTASGGVCVNDTVIQAAVPELPFGGAGASGMGRYHGEAGFKSFSNERIVFVQSRLSVTGLLQPPFGKTAERILSGLLRR
jgi:coniferyl-aldehyde dehydrogenase